ncbi:DUF3553 domain-containing protein, partial [bacterium]|nr:DUF3553 domain-containing protein [bacterium]
MKELKQGDFVKVETRPEWGTGFVLEGPRDGKIRVLFPRIGERKLAIAHPALVKTNLSQKEAERWRRLTEPTRAYRSLEELVNTFLHHFNAGFKDDKYYQWERSYKVRTAELMQELLGKDVMSELIKSGEHGEVAQRAKKILQEPDALMPASFELIAFTEALKSDQNRQIFTTSLERLLYGDESEEQRFNSFVICLDQLGVAKWPIQTYFPFFAFPKEHLFLKP